MEVVEWFGRYHRIARPGFSCILCCFGQSVAGRLSTELQHHEVGGGPAGLPLKLQGNLACKACIWQLAGLPRQPRLQHGSMAIDPIASMRAAADSAPMLRFQRRCCTQHRSYRMEGVRLVSMRHGEIASPCCHALSRAGAVRV